MIAWLLAVALATDPSGAAVKARDPQATPAERAAGRDAVVPGVPSEVVRAASDLGMTRPFVQGVQVGLELLYERRYDDMRRHFRELEAVYPNTGIQGVAEVLAWQSMMLENFDFRYDDAYKVASASARQRLDAARKVPGSDAWERLMLGVVSGIEAIHAARQSRYLPALTLAFEAIDHIEGARTLAPLFIDLQLADGLYHYWRTALTEQSKVLPSFGDQKQQGIDEIQAVIERGVFLAAPARLALAFTWMEERKYDRARDLLLVNQAAYPSNIINEEMLGISYLSMHAYPPSLQSFDTILRIDSSNQRAHYYRAVSLLKLKRFDESIVALKTYLAFPGLADWHQSGAYFRLGSALEAKEVWVGAMAAYNKAVQIDGHASAKAAVARLKKLEREGTITL